MFGMMAQFVNLSRCGVPHHPLVVAQTGDEYCQKILHHVVLQEYTDIQNHLSKEFSGVLEIRSNDWSQATGPLGFLLAFGSGTGHVHADVVPPSPPGFCNTHRTCWLVLTCQPPSRIHDFSLEGVSGTRASSSRSSKVGADDGGW